MAAIFALPLTPVVSLTQAQEVVAEEGVEVLTRGPVHEAFVETVVFKPTAGILAPKAAPALIEELPPEQRPEGDRVQWIPGYWSWDDETDEFIWVSGIWRNIPPGRQWIPGYWQESGDQWQWVSGYWANETVEEVEYLPEPPARINEGINIKRPSTNSIWIPGNWAYRQDRYLWSPGYWEDARPNWVWMPGHYNWTPYGYVYVDGYWDYDVPRRGLCFAPVRFAPTYYGRPGYRYNPVITIALDLLTDSLFIRPRHRHYYFGDYYAADYRTRGFYSYNTYFSGGHGYDPIFAHQRWRHRDDSRWERRVAENFAFYRENSDQRPPRTYSAFQAFTRSNPDVKRRFATDFAAPLATVATRQDRPFRLKKVDDTERQKFVTNSREIRDFGDRWKKAAPQAAVAPAPATEKPRGEKSVPVEPKRVKVPRSPLVSKLPEATTAADTPPPVRPEPKVTDNPKFRPGGKNRVPDNTQPGITPKETPDETPAVKPGAEPKITPAPGDEPKRNPGNPKERPGREPSVEPKPVPSEPGVNPKPSPKEEPKMTPKVEPKVTPREEPKVTPREEPRVTPKVEPAPEPRRPKPSPRETPRVEPRETPKVKPQPEPRETPKIQPRETPRPMPKVEPRPNPTPKVEPRPNPTPKVEPRPNPTPRVEPRPNPAPKVEPRPAPRVEPKIQPRPDPRPAPSISPKPVPSPRPSNDDKEKGKGKNR